MYILNTTDAIIIIIIVISTGNSIIVSGNLIQFKCQTLLTLIFNIFYYNFSILLPY